MTIHNDGDRDEPNARSARIRAVVENIRTKFEPPRGATPERKEELRRLKQEEIERLLPIQELPEARQIDSDFDARELAWSSMLLSNAAAMIERFLPKPGATAGERERAFRKLIAAVRKSIERPEEQDRTIEVAKSAFEEAQRQDTERKKTEDAAQLRQDCAAAGRTSVPGETWRRVEVEDDPLSRQFHLVEFVAEGGTSVVWRCRTEFANIRTVVKLLKFDYERIKSMLAWSEMRALLKLRHPNIVEVYDAGHLKRPDGRIFPYLAMEDLTGSTLRTVVKNRSFTLPEAVRVIATVAGAVAFCHENDVPHGDISPANIFVISGVPTPENLKLIDFGYTDEPAATPGFGDPVAFTGDPTGQKRRDLYGLAATLFFCLTGHAPALQAGPDDVSLQERLDSLLRKISDETIRHILARAMNLDLAQR